MTEVTEVKPEPVKTRTAAVSLQDGHDKEGFPWAVCDDWSDDPDLVSIVDAYDTIVAHMVGSADHPRTKLQAALIVRAVNSFPKLIEALGKIAAWELPTTGKTWPHGEPMSYGACFGSNGEKIISAIWPVPLLKKQRGNGRWTPMS